LSGFFYDSKKTPENSDKISLDPFQSTGENNEYIWYRFARNGCNHGGRIINLWT
jgi:hypothetical protein